MTVAWKDRVGVGADVGHPGQGQLLVHGGEDGVAVGEGEAAYVALRVLEGQHHLREVLGPGAQGRLAPGQQLRHGVDHEARAQAAEDDLVHVLAFPVDEAQGVGAPVAVLHDVYLQRRLPDRYQPDIADGGLLARGLEAEVQPAAGRVHDRHRHLVGGVQADLGGDVHVGQGRDGGVVGVDGEHALSRGIYRLEEAELYGIGGAGEPAHNVMEVRPPTLLLELVLLPGDDCWSR